MSESPLVSIALTTFNVARFLPETLAGIEAQTYSPIELVAYDDASSDASPEILERFRQSASFHVEVLGGTTNIGFMPALKKAISACTGKYVAILDGDDVWLPGKLGAQVGWFEEDESRVLCGHDVECFESETDRVLWTARGRRLLQTGRGAARAIRNGPIFPTSAVMLRRDAIPDFNPLGLRRYEDWSLWSDCLLDAGAYGYVDAMYSRYRRNPRGIVARMGQSVEESTEYLEASLVWLGGCAAQHPQYERAICYRRATLMANHGRLLFEAGHARQAKRYLRASIVEYGRSFWKAAGLTLIASLPTRIARSVYSVANRLRLDARRALS
jgi:glycosyltransferase involved in cell wall biosynthesis